MTEQKVLSTDVAVREVISWKITTRMKIRTKFLNGLKV